MLDCPVDYQQVFLLHFSDLICLFNFPFFSHLHNSFCLLLTSPRVAIWGIGKKLSLIPDFTNYNKILYSLNLPHLSPWSPNLGLDFNNLGDSELQNLLNNMSQQQLMQVLWNEPLYNMFFVIICFPSAVWRLTGRWQCLWSCQPVGWSRGAESETGLQLPLTIEL